MRREDVQTRETTQQRVGQSSNIAAELNANGDHTFGLFTG